LADATGNAAIVRQGIFEHKTRHAGLSPACQIVMDLAEAVFAVIVIGVDDDKGGMDQLFGRQDRLAGAPGLGAPFGKLAGDIMQVLESVVHRNAVIGTDSSHAVPDGLPERSLDVFTNYKNNMVEASLHGVMDGIVHNDMPAGVHRFQLLDAAAKAGANACGHDEQSCVHVFSFLVPLDCYAPYILSTAQMVWKISFQSSQKFRSCMYLRSSSIHSSKV